MELTGIPGVGQKTAAALAELEDAERAIESGDVATLARAPGVSPGRAARIAREAIRASHGDTGDFLATDCAREIYEELLDRLQARAQTEYGARRLETFFPTAAGSRIEEVRAFSERALDRQPDSAVGDVLSGVAPLRSPPEVRVRERCLATADAERYATAREQVPELSVEIVEDARELAELARGYATVVALDERFAGMDLAGDVRVRPDALERPADVVPERTLAFYATNRDSIRAAIAVHRRSGLDPPTDLDHLDALLDRLDPDGTPSADEELDRLTAAVADVDASVATAESVANDHLREAIRERDVTIEGDDLLNMVERGAGVDSLLSRELSEEFDGAIAAARAHLVDALQLTDDEAGLAHSVFPDRPTFPVDPDEEAVGRLREALKAARDRRAMAVKRELAEALAGLRGATKTLVHRALELDVELAIAQFARDFDCTMPALDGDGITIEGGRSPLLDVSPDAVEPVDYRVADVVLLSGVNSGGKTSLLDLLAATVILAQMGLPVPADRARLQRFDGLHYHAATQGTLDAGAFEATLRHFAELAEGAGGRLVLVDELESITEPGAAANIVAGILEELRGEATAVVVSHLAAEIREVADERLRVDGIEAEGVIDGELIVDRTPVQDHLARSTPELIVERLAETAEGRTAGFYDRLLEKF